MGLGRVELPTSPLSGVRSSRLSYRPVPLRSRSLPYEGIQSLSKLGSSAGSTASKTGFTNIRSSGLERSTMKRKFHGVDLGAISRVRVSAP
jgi:hypothetical protein